MSVLLRLGVFSEQKKKPATASLRENQLLECFKKMITHFTVRLF